jgi:hypothetical protein
MLLKYLDLYLNLEEYPGGLTTPFGFQTRYLCNFVERQVRRLKFNADGFSKICVQGRHEPEESCPIVPVSAAVPSVAFDQRRYEALGPGEHHEFFIGMLLDGLAKCARHHRTPLAEMQSAIEDFRRGGYRNEWLHQKKTLGPAGIQAYLLCALDTERFVLTLRLERKGEKIFEQPILETKPDETIFAHRFKDVVLEDGAVVVKNQFGKPTFSVELASI